MRHHIVPERAERRSASDELYGASSRAIGGSEAHRAWSKVMPRSEGACARLALKLLEVASSRAAAPKYLEEYASRRAQNAAGGARDTGLTFELAGWAVGLGTAILWPCGLNL